MTRVGVLIILLLGMFVGQPASAQERVDSLAELQRQILVLAEEVSKLRLGESLYDRPSQERGLGPAGSTVYRSTKQGVSLASYGEAIYQNYAATADDGSPSMRKDQLDYLRAVLYVGYTYNEWILFNSEIEFEHASTGKGGEVSVELAYLELLFSRAANMRAGLVLIPVGIINEKHEPTTFVGTLRPLVEQVVVPSTWRALGVGSYGEIASWLNYRAYVVEGLNAQGFSASSGIRGGRQSGAKAVAENLAFTGKIEALPFTGGMLAGSFFWGRSGQGMEDSLGVLDVPTFVWSVHTELNLAGIDIRALYAQTTVGQSDRLSAAVGSTVGSRMEGWYANASYDVLPLIIPGSTHSLSPYVQYERANTQASVAQGATPSGGNDTRVLTLGLMYKPYPWVAFKADIRDVRNEAGTGLNQWNLALNYLF